MMNKLYNYSKQARFACLRCAAGGPFVSAGGSLWLPGVTLVNYKGGSISKYDHLSDLLKSTSLEKTPNLKILTS